jgi:hypothetical protein
MNVKLEPPQQIRARRLDSAYVDPELPHKEESGVRNRDVPIYPVAQNKTSNTRPAERARVRCPATSATMQL